MGNYPCGHIGPIGDQTSGLAEFPETVHGGEPVSRRKRDDLRCPAITQANIHQTICSPTWSTKTIRPPVTYTSRLKQRQLAHATDKTPAHYEEDHYREKVLH